MFQLLLTLDKICHLYAAICSLMLNFEQIVVHSVSIRVHTENVSWLRILDVYSLQTAITPTILDVFYGPKNVVRLVFSRNRYGAVKLEIRYW